MIDWVTALLVQRPYLAGLVLIWPYLLSLVAVLVVLPLGMSQRKG